MAAICGFNHLIAGFNNAELTERVAGLLERRYTGRQATYHLRRLRRKGIIEHSRSTHRYQLTDDGRRIVMLFTKAHSRILAPESSSWTKTCPTTSPSEVPWHKLGESSTAP